MDEYYEREQTLEARDISALYSSGLVEYPNATQDLPGYHFDKDFAHAEEGSRQTDASKNEVSDKIQPQNPPKGSGSLGVQLDGRCKTVTSQEIYPNTY